ncbi:MAG: M28 family metallopeptidase [Acidobacteria bacterium]|nr:M28 family metallopeptidase [Acidobacteriota bacterium]
MFVIVFRTAAILLLSISVVAQTMPFKSLMGFSPGSSSKQSELEKKFDQSLKRENLREWMKFLSARPHHVGSPKGKENAEFMLKLFQSWGYDAKIEQFDVLFPTPKTRLLEMTLPEKFTAKLDEPLVAGDATSGQKDEQLPSYNAFSIDGDVTAPLVYVNYGIPRDYDELERRGIDVKGKIVIARYGGSWRGIKPKVAAERGAIGCLIYSDPRDDGYYQGDVYPKGAWRNENGAQRGSVADMPVFPGDVLTPGVPATKDAKRLDRKDAPTITKIPVMPISYGDALPLLRALEGPVVPDSWRGALPITYHFGGGDNTRIRLKREFNWDIRPAYDVVARLPGAEFPDEWIIRGNHHDAWVNGASDPISGVVAMLEEARAIGELAKTGWKPKRTIVFAAWDAEEPGLLGSTEWVEMHAEELSNKAAVYINTDSNGRGFLGMGGSHTLEKFANEVARSVPDPQTKLSVWERTRANQIVNATPTVRNEILNRSDLRIGALGSGSDYTPFLQHLGIASLDIGFGGESGGGSYHSIYDSFDHYARFGDPGFDYGVALAKVCGRSVLRLANAEVLPFEFTNFGDTVGTYVNEVVRLTDSMREETAALNQLLESGMLVAVQDPKKTFVAPKPNGPVPSLDFSPLQKALARLRESAKNFQETINGRQFSPATARELNSILMKTERALTSPNGLPRREWFRHQIYAPGFYTGYGVKTLPAVRESIEQRDWIEAGRQIQLVSATIERFAEQVDRAAKVAK